MIRASVVSPMIGDGLTAATAFRPRLFDIPGVVSFEDVTGANAPVAPNACVFVCVFEDAAFDLVAADTAYLVNWSEPYAP